MDNMKILEQYANEYCDVLNAYDPNNQYAFSEFEGDKIMLYRSLWPFAVIMKDEEKKAVSVMTIQHGIFIDNSPFETSKEANTNDN
jgi:hypothetical protein